MVYNKNYLAHLIAMDRKDDMPRGIVEYGLHKVSTLICVGHKNQVHMKWLVNVYLMNLPPTS
jgi:hypothetical protein